MIILISGGCKNGKSSLAQKIACDLAKNEGPDSHLVYFATMIPKDGEDDERIKKHREDREGLGFETIESGKDIDIAAQKLKEKSIVLFDSLTALTANELFSGSESKDGQKVMQKLQKELTVLIEKASSVVFVSDAIYSDGKIYGELTERYRQILADTENFIAKKSDRVMEMTGDDGSCFRIECT